MPVIETIRGIYELDVMTLNKIADRCQNTFWKEVTESWITYCKTFNEQEFHSLSFALNLKL